MKVQQLNRLGMIVLAMMTGMLFTQCEKNSGLDSVSQDFNIVADRDGDSDLCTCLNASFPRGDLSATETEALMYMREEEKLARDVYLILGETWGSMVFTNIANSEQRHMDAVLCLIERYQLSDPALGNDQGLFQNQQLQNLYADLVTSGKVSLPDAFIVGATIEDLDIYDLRRALSDDQVDNADVRAVFENLMRGSRNHLRAFTRNLDQLNLVYTPQYLTGPEYEAIITGPWETGNGMFGICQWETGGNQNGPHGGNGNGPGNGNCGHPGHGNGPGDGTGICPYDNVPQGPNGQFHKGR